MKSTHSPHLRNAALLGAVLAAALAWKWAPNAAEAGAPPSKDDHPEAAATPAAASSAAIVAAAANRFLSLLDEDARGKARYELGDDERFNWAFTPVSRNGLPLKDMTVEQRAAAHALLQATLSSQGYHKANAIIELERILGLLEGRPQRRDPEDYYVAIFGAPSATEAWAWRFEGHHLSLNFSAPANELAVTGPAFMGANPATVPSGQKAGWRPLGREEDLARSLLLMLSPEQREMAVISAEAPRDIITGNDREARLDGFEGIPASRLTEEQRAVLMRVIHEYTGNMQAGAAEAWMARIHGDVHANRIHFAWAGSPEPGEGHYYRIHAPDFLIEYDNTQGDANHVHSVWRDLHNDFGGDALARHYEEGHEHN